MKAIAVMSAVLVAGVAFGQDPVKVESTDGGAMVGVDMLSKPSETVQFVKANWGKLLLGTGAAIGAVYVIDKYVEKNEGSGGKKKKKLQVAPAPVDGLGIATFGSNSPVYIETMADNVSVETHGDNSPITIKEPPLPEVPEAQGEDGGK